MLRYVRLVPAAFVMLLFAGCHQGGDTPLAPVPGAPVFDSGSGYDVGGNGPADEGSGESTATTEAEDGSEPERGSGYDVGGN